MFAAACLFAAEMEECIVGKSCDTSRPGIRGGEERSTPIKLQRRKHCAGQSWELGVWPSQVLHTTNMLPCTRSSDSTDHNGNNGLLLKQSWPQCPEEAVRSPEPDHTLNTAVLSV